MSFVEVKQKEILKNKIFSKHFVTTEPTKYGLKLNVLSIRKRKLIKECLSFMLNKKRNQRNMV